MYPPTKKLFHADPYQTQAQANVLGVKDEYVVLDRTIFYAESGGQDPDLGSIGGRPVVDVQDQWGRLHNVTGGPVDVPAVKVDTIVVHRLSRAADLGEGETVELAIDWDRRYKLMRNHSASHFVFHAVNSMSEDKTGNAPHLKGCHITDGGARFDFAADIPSEWTPEIEKLANGWIAKGDPIDMAPEPSSDEIYYWTCGDIVIPCGGTHVRGAGELGAVKLKRSKKGRGLTRIGFDGVSGEPG